MNTDNNIALYEADARSSALYEAVVNSNKSEPEIALGAAERLLELAEKTGDAQFIRTARINVDKKREALQGKSQ